MAMAAAIQAVAPVGDMGAVAAPIIIPAVVTAGAILFPNTATEDTKAIRATVDSAVDTVVPMVADTLVPRTLITSTVITTAAATDIEPGGEGATVPTARCGWGPVLLLTVPGPKHLGFSIHSSSLVIASPTSVHPWTSSRIARAE